MSVWGSIRFAQFFEESAWNDFLNRNGYLSTDGQFVPGAFEPVYKDDRERPVIGLPGHESHRLFVEQVHIIIEHSKVEPWNPSGVLRFAAHAAANFPGDMEAWLFDSPP